jgi:hypothetical protein
MMVVYWYSFSNPYTFMHSLGLCLMSEKSLCDQIFWTPPLALVCSTPRPPSFLRRMRDAFSLEVSVHGRDFSVSLSSMLLTLIPFYYHSYHRVRQPISPPSAPTSPSLYTAPAPVPFLPPLLSSILGPTTLGSYLGMYGQLQVLQGDLEISLHSAWAAGGYFGR